MRKIEYSDRGFPLYKGEELSWSIGSYLTGFEAQADYPRMRVVIRAMQERRPEQLKRERLEMLMGSCDRMFGHNARKVLEVIDQASASDLAPWQVND